MKQRHHDGHGLNDKLIIRCDDRDPGAGGASHNYTAKMDDTDEQVITVCFQYGPRDTGEPGCTDAALLAIVLDRYEGFQSGPYKCRENALVITKLEEALHWMQHRANDRARRGVLGRNEK